MRLPFAALLLTLTPALASAQDTPMPERKAEKREALERQAHEDTIRRKKLEAAKREAEEDEDEDRDAIRRKKLEAAEDDCEECDDADDEDDGDVIRRKKLEAAGEADEERELVRRKKLEAAGEADDEREQRLVALKLGVEETCRQIEAEARARIEAVRAKALAEAQRMAAEEDRGGDWKQERGGDEGELRARLDRLEAAVSKLAELVERLATRQR